MRTLLAFLLLVSSLVAAAPAAAADGPASGRTAVGAVTALGADSLTVKPAHDPALTCAVPQEKQAAFAQLNLSLGERVAVSCVQRGAGYVLARISTTPPPQPPPRQERQRSVEGVLVSLSADSITIKPGRGEALTCAVGNVSVDGLALGNRVGAVCRGDGGHYVLVKVRKLGDGTQTKPPAPGVRVVEGTLAANSSDSVSVQQGNGETVVCAVPPELRASVAALGLQVGDHVVAGCRRDGDRWLLVAIKRA